MCQSVTRSPIELFWTAKKHNNTKNTLVLWPETCGKKHKNTQNTCLVHLSFWSWRKTQKHAKYKGGCPCSVWASPHVYNKTQKIQKTKPKKYKNTSNTGLLQFLNGIKNTQNTWVVWTSLQYCLLAHLHVGVKKYKNTQWLTIFFVFMVKKHKIT